MGNGIGIAQQEQKKGQEKGSGGIAFSPEEGGDEGCRTENGRPKGTGCTASHGYEEKEQNDMEEYRFPPFRTQKQGEESRQKGDVHSRDGNHMGESPTGEK